MVDGVLQCILTYKTFEISAILELTFSDKFFSIITSDNLTLFEDNILHYHFLTVEVKWREV